MRIRVRHTYDFGDARSLVGRDLLAPGAWEAARSVPGPFALPESRTEWEAWADDEELRARARDIARIAADLGAMSLCSHGVGRGLLELNIARAAPTVQLTVTERAAGTVARLVELFPEALVVRSDLANDELPHADVHLMHRLDAELDDEEWRRVFDRVSGPVIFVPNVVLDLGGAAREIGRRLLRRRLTAAGWFRNDAALRALWSRTHIDRRVPVGDASAYLLLPR